MTRNANFIRGDGSVTDYFDRAAVAAMLQAPQNSDLSSVRIVSMQSIDSSTSRVNVSMTWAGTSRTATYTVRKDAKQVHFFFYDSWRIDIPYSTMSVSLPNQPGLVQVDGIYVPTGTSSKSIQVIGGYHKVTMARTSFYQAETKVVNGVDANPTVAFDGKISPDAMTAVGDSVKNSLNNHCDSSKYFQCPGHTYQAPNDGYIWYLTMPGYGEIQYNTYVFAFNGDPTTDMKLVVTGDLNKLTATGACATTLTVDGSRNCHFTGTWSANVTWNGYDFASQVTFACATAKA